MKLDVFSIFPEYLAPLRLSLIGKAIDKGLLDLAVHDLRAFTHDRHRTVDDTPYGGGAGMVMRPEPWGEALESVLGSIPERPVESSDPAPSSEGGFAPVAAAAEPGPLLEAGAGQDPVDASGTGDVREGGARPILLVPSPSGTPFTQAAARELAHAEHIVVACGRYEGIDQRVMDAAADIAEVRTYSIGDYVLNGGEVATMVMVEAIARLIPGVIGNPASLTEESYEDDLLEYPVYTKPATWKGHEVPPILLSGNHAAIERWRRDRRLERTSRTRPDLLARIPAADLDKSDRAFLASLAEDPRED